jgi:hypothetical protein
VCDDRERKIQTLRAQLVELAATIRKLDQSGLSSARAQLLLSRKRAALEDLIERGSPALAPCHAPQAAGEQGIPVGVAVHDRDNSDRD